MSYGGKLSSFTACHEWFVELLVQCYARLSKDSPHACVSEHDLINCWAALQTHSCSLTVWQKGQGPLTAERGLDCKPKILSQFNGIEMSGWEI